MRRWLRDALLKAVMVGIVSANEYALVQLSPVQSILSRINQLTNLLFLREVMATSSNAQECSIRRRGAETRILP